jgi:uncharacterized protein YcnI
MRTARTARITAATALCAAAFLLGSQPASAHISIPGEGTKGGFAIVSLSVPNERDDASTTTLTVQIPQDQAIPFVSAQPKPGWTVTTTTRTLAEPVTTEGETISEVVDTVTWTGGGIEPGQFDLFSLSVGPLPTDVDELAFPAVQTYSSGEEVRWIDPTPASGEEPEHPAPVLKLVDADIAAETQSEVTSETTSSDDDSNALAVAALIIGALGLAAGLGAIATTRRART